MWAGQVTGKDTGAIWGLVCAAQEQEAPPMAAPGPRASVPGGRPGKEASSRLPPRPHPAATPASALPARARRPSDTRAGRGGAAKVPRSPQRPAPPRLPRRAFLTSPSSPPPPPPPLPVGRPEVTQRAGANGAGHVIAGEPSAARSEAREVVPETRVGVGGREGLPGISEKKYTGGHVADSRPPGPARTASPGVPGDGFELDCANQSPSQLRKHVY